jgi:hypothetical protein
MPNNNQTISITFSECVENHQGMQTIGQKCDSGYQIEQLKQIQKEYMDKGVACELKMLSDELPQKDRVGNEAAILIIRQFLQHHDLDLDELETEQFALIYDNKAKFRGQVKNKLARHNLCFAHEHQNPNYEEGKGTVYSFGEVPKLQKVREIVSELMDEETALLAESNLYYDYKKCGIGYHGDTERSKVVCLRLGKEMNLVYRWFKKSTPLHKEIKLTLQAGDLYIMSDKATGNDWKKSSILTLRHAAGAAKYTTIKNFG